MSENNIDNRFMLCMGYVLASLGQKITIADEALQQWDCENFELIYKYDVTTNIHTLELKEKDDSTTN